MIDLSRLQESDLFGRFYLKVPGNKRFDNYFQTVDVLRPLLGSKEWAEVMTGYYINVAGNMDAVRLSYFSSTPDNVKSCIESFCRDHNLTESQDCELPRAIRISWAYGNEELRFRRFLYIYTLIGLDIMQADLLNARRLMATFRFQIMLSRLPYKPHFQKVFETQSSSYNSLSNEQKEQFWLDLSNWPDLRQVDWAHMMVNMILPGDLVGLWGYFSNKKPPLSIKEINEITRENFEVEIPEQWHPV